MMSSWPERLVVQQHKGVPRTQLFVNDGSFDVREREERRQARKNCVAN